LIYSKENKTARADAINTSSSLATTTGKAAERLKLIITQPPHPGLITGILYPLGVWTMKEFMLAYGPHLPLILGTILAGLFAVYIFVCVFLLPYSPTVKEPKPKKGRDRGTTPDDCHEPLPPTAAAGAAIPTPEASKDTFTWGRSPEHLPASKPIPAEFEPIPAPNWPVKVKHE
jgi:hypothetical protein